MIAKRALELLKTREFISVATASSKGRPNAAPKLLLKVEDNVIYLVDYIISTTWENLKNNPLVSLSFMDTESLIGYQVNGSVEIIDSGKVHDQILKELFQREIDLSTKRIIEGVVKGKVHEGFEVNIPNKIVIFKIKVEEVVEIGASGILKREKLCSS